ncbi:MAG TPA: peptide ligase PGM1-related protein [Gemmatimonadota bacterium]|nr:peptide ligase PGM1-related protein [Gemmatimonadota bacterium]
MTSRIFLHSPSEAPDAARIVEQIPEFERYGERALLLARPGDVVCLAHSIDERYLSFLRTLEIGPRDEDVLVISSVEPGAGLSARLIDDPQSLDWIARRLSGSTRSFVCPFFATPDAFAVGRALHKRLSRPVRVLGGPAGLVRKLHEKVAARALAESLGIPVAPGEVVQVVPADGSPPDLSVLRRAIERWSDATGHVIVRGSSGASGSSTFTSRSGDIDAMIDGVGERRDNAVYLVEPLFEASSSPNVEIVVEPGVSLPDQVGVTDQVLDPDLVYKGSTHPSRALRVPQMIEDSRAIVAWMRRRGFTGRVGFDYVEHEGKGGRAEHFLAEINPRINGASYPLALTRHLAALASRFAAPAPRAFLTANVRVRARDFGELERLSRSLLYDPARGEGIVPHTVGALSFGKVGITCLGGSREAVEALRERFVQLAGARPARTTSGAAS